MTLDFNGQEGLEIRADLIVSRDRCAMCGPLPLLKDQQRGVALGVAVGVRHHRRGNRPVAVVKL
jgi:hypothetical protein